MQWQRVLLRIILFACLGLLIELFFTATFELCKGNWNMHGHSSPWMTVVYGLLGLFTNPIAIQLKKWYIPFVVRAGVYMILIFLVEYLFGVLFQIAGLQIWDYSHYSLNLHGHITLLYAPFWFGLGLCIEYLYRKLDVCATAMTIGYSTEEIMDAIQKRDDSSQPSS
ncbi:MAG: hypothetical protein KAH38_12605 [Candidatus Hydrogenedentes bacterium]|nr:hypothetical protein [Candidatus Hydrogenedentota bacterium]